MPVYSDKQTGITGSPYELKLLATIPDTVASERLLHNEFSHRQVRGEWFKFESRREIMSAFGIF
jgi:hypothetical protein